MKTSALTRALPRWGAITAMVIACRLAVVNAGAQDRSLNPQYGFLHRVNTAANIVHALNCPARGIEFDVSWDIDNEEGGDRWWVCHDYSSIDKYTPTLEYWLTKLKEALDTHSYDGTFSALFVDLKTPNNGDVGTVLNLLRQYVPTNVIMFIDLQGVENFTTSTTGYDKIKTIGLRPNEGLSCWIARGDDYAQQVSNYFRIMHQDQIERNGVDHGYAGPAGINQDILTAINEQQYHDIRDPYRFKKLLTWPNREKDVMEHYVNPGNSYHTDGQLCGWCCSEWLGTDLCFTDYFADAVNNYSGSQRVADPSDVASFWDRSESDYVSGDLIYVNNLTAVTLGACQTGAKWQPYITVTNGLTHAKTNALVIITPASPYTAVTRMDKPSRLEKSTDWAGVVRITR